ncbi:MAG TPA: hypothetical protein VEC99_15415 [Clostridia bacterium]|nr:hypothetical protein [Clostridia bacterium]
MPIKPQATHGVDSGHESKDITIRWVVVAALVLLATAVLVHIAMWLMDRALARGREPIGATGALRPNVRLNSQWRNFPEPRLQTSPKQDMATFNAREEAELHSYGWVNRDAGQVRIPIARAMDLIAERGLPTRTHGVAPTGTKTPLDLLQERRDREAEKFKGRP